jgi:hypothetical protein
MGEIGIGVSSEGSKMKTLHLRAKYIFMNKLFKLINKTQNLMNEWLDE